MIDALRRYAVTYTGETPADDDLDFTCEYASVPALEHADTPYVFLYADSPVDQEHGVCFLVRDSDVLCCCHGDMSLQFFGWDNTDALDELADNIT